MTQKKMKICFVLGTRPEITKLYSVMIAAASHEEVTPIIVHTGQHYDYEMSQVFLEELKLPEFHYFLDVKSGTHGEMTAKLLIEVEKALQKERPDVVVVLGDTNTTMAGALAAVKLEIPVAHVEAGCRSFDFSMPEEINRLVSDSIASVFFAPSKVAALNLLYEGKPYDRVFQAGNTVVDIVEDTREIREKMKLESVDEPFDVVVTLHRQENVDNKERLEALLIALTNIRGRVVFPIHPRTMKRIEEFHLTEIFRGNENIKIIKPLNYLSFMKLLEDAEVIITDSGGVQEEAIMVGTPCITARDTTEWPETVWEGGNFLAGTSTEIIHERCNAIIQEKAKYSFKNPFKGNAGNNMIQILLDLWSKKELMPVKPDMSGGKYPLPWLVKKGHHLKNEFQGTLSFDNVGKGGHEDASMRVIRGSEGEQ
ncbi:MAG: non-hydrolyzing UDP-N-acetylglucosamine 2-epimerase [Candidatus Thorarchaeota archaeon]